MLMTFIQGEPGKPGEDGKPGDKGASVSTRFLLSSEMPIIIFQFVLTLMLVVVLFIMFSCTFLLL